VFLQRAADLTDQRGPEPGFDGPADVPPEQRRPPSLVAIHAGDAWRGGQAPDLARRACRPQGCGPPRSTGPTSCSSPTPTSTTSTGPTSSPRRPGPPWSATTNRSASCAPPGSPTPGSSPSRAATRSTAATASPSAPCPHSTPAVCPWLAGQRPGLPRRPRRPGPAAPGPHPGRLRSHLHLVGRGPRLLRPRQPLHLVLRRGPARLPAGVPRRVATRLRQRGYWRSIFEPLRPDVAILGATGRPVWTVSPTKAHWPASSPRKPTLLGHPEVIFCHYDPSTSRPGTRSGPAGGGRADHGPVLVDPPAALAVAGDRRRSLRRGWDEKSRRYRSGPLTRSRASVRAMFIPGVTASAGPVGPVEQPHHFWQAGHGGTIRGKSAGEAGTPPRLAGRVTVALPAATGSR
jgi:hypothetical protein